MKYITPSPLGEGWVRGNLVKMKWLYTSFAPPKPVNYVTYSYSFVHYLTIISPILPRFNYFNLSVF